MMILKNILRIVKLMKWGRMFKTKKYFFALIILFNILSLNGCANQKALLPKNIEFEDSLTIVLKNEQIIDEVDKEELSVEVERTPLEPSSNNNSIEEIIDVEQKQIKDSMSDKVMTEEKQEMIINIQVGNKSFNARLVDNETTRALIEQFPLTISMGDLNQNEKYYYFDQPLPRHSETVSQINSGDLMLFGSDCLVLFYESFSTSYNYTRLAKIEDTSSLKDTLGSGHVEITISLLYR